MESSLKKAFADDGYIAFAGVVDRQRLADLDELILAEFERVKAAGELFAGGGVVSGHLNCFPGAVSRFVYETLESEGILDVVRALSPDPLRAPNVGCNLNLPNSSEQNEHIDGYASRPFLIVNVAAVDTDLSNGAMEILPRTHLRNYKHWQILLDRPHRRRLCMRQGDVVIRTSTLWHRGMPNPGARPRPMLAFTWEDGGSSHADPYQANGGRISFLPNRYATGWSGRLRERAYVAAPRVTTLLRAAQSLFER
jgi:hypothetical protein